ncbi:FmdB family zinc ribbon protein [Candidatus Latescibacterota bacterium]
MLVYEYICKKCSKKHTVTMTITEHEKRRPACPSCGSRSMKHLITPFSVITSKKS